MSNVENINIQHEKDNFASHETHILSHELFKNMKIIDINSHYNCGFKDDVEICTKEILNF